MAVVKFGNRPVRGSHPICLVHKMARSLTSSASHQHSCSLETFGIVLRRLRALCIVFTGFTCHKRRPGPPPSLPFRPSPPPHMRGPRAAIDSSPHPPPSVHARIGRPAAHLAPPRRSRCPDQTGKPYRFNQSPPLRVHRVTTSWARAHAPSTNTLLLPPRDVVSYSFSFPAGVAFHALLFKTRSFSAFFGGE
jgi:hypothetical protein